eukprot:COSAG01_NODE_927_length_12693_cov_16.333810_5_plen_88_part_00
MAAGDGVACKGSFGYVGTQHCIAAPPQIGTLTGNWLLRVAPGIAAPPVQGASEGMQCPEYAKWRYACTTWEAEKWRFCHHSHTTGWQ